MSKRMTSICSWLVVAAVCVVAADNAQEEGANTDVSLGEFDLDDQCHKTAEIEWAFLTRSGLPDSVVLLQSKVSDTNVFDTVT